MLCSSGYVFLGVVVGPILHGNGKLDILFDNEGNSWLGNNGENFLFKNLGNGTFIDVAKSHGISDDEQNGRGVALADFNQDGLLDIVIGNWEGPHRLYVQKINEESHARSFENVANSEFEEPSMVRTVLVADFDNDGATEVLFNNINDFKKAQPNRLFRVYSEGAEGPIVIRKLEMGAAEEPQGYGTGNQYTLS